MQEKLQSIAIEPSFDLSPLKKFVREQVLPRAKESDRLARFNFEIYQSLHKMGIMTAAVPAEFGGHGLSVVDLAGVCRELAYGSSGCSATFIGNLLGLSTVLSYANEELKAKICKEYMSEFGLWSFAMTEANCGSDLMQTATIAVETKDGFTINGEKNFITNATHSSRLGVFARHVDINGRDQGISCFFIPGEAEGLKRGPKMDKLGWRESNTGTLFFNDVKIPRHYQLGETGAGLGILTHCLNRSKTLLGAVSVGVASRALDLGHERLAETERYGKPLLAQSAIRHLLAKLHTDKEAAWLLTCRAASTWDEGLDAVKESSMAKYFAGRMGREVTNQICELFGARGYFNDFEISRLYRDSKAIEIVEGPSLVQELLIAKHVIPRPAKKAEKAADVYQFEPDKKRSAG